MPDNNSEDEKYNLYTEHIVPGKGKKIKRVFKKMLFVLASAVVFGLVAGLIMIITYRAGISFLPGFNDETRPSLVVGPSTSPDESVTSTQEPETDSKDPVTLSPTEGGESTENVTDEPQTQEPDTEPDQSDKLSEVHDRLKKVAAEIQKSHVSLIISTASNDPLSGLYQSEMEYFGVIVAQDTESYYILTSHSDFDETSEIKVTYNDSTVVDGTFVAGDSVLGIAVISAPLSSSTRVSVAKFGDSALMAVGDPILSSGRIFGISGAVGYGMVVKTGSTVSGTDAQFEVINTDIVAPDAGSGVIYNLKGEIVGVITDCCNNGCINAYSMSTIKNRIETVINAQPIVYFGIQGQSVTAELLERYGIPEGIYVSAVEVGSPAYSVGIQTGDVIVKIAKKTMKSVSDMMDVLAVQTPGESVTVTVKRKGRDSYKEIVFSVVLGVQ